MTAETPGQAVVSPPKPPRQRRPTRIGVVSSDKRDKTIKVLVSYQVMHAKYGKRLQRRSVLHVHDENNEAVAGDRVEIAMCRPISKTKSWRLVRVVTPTPQGGAA